MGLFLLLYVVIGATFAGSFMVVMLAIGMDTLQPVLYSSLAGFVVGIPVAWIVARKIKENM
ncbi:MAG: CTP synthetase [Rhodobacterales bacterium]|nr:MAG: CTP synthetase [Rhodobacterales bacterium]